MLGVGEKLPPLELIPRGAVSPSKSPSSLLSESNTIWVDHET
jgi:hypothetical protein